MSLRGLRSTFVWNFDTNFTASRLWSQQLVNGQACGPNGYTTVVAGHTLFITRLSIVNSICCSYSCAAGDKIARHAVSSQSIRSPCDTRNRNKSCRCKTITLSTPQILGGYSFKSR